MKKKFLITVSVIVLLAFIFGSVSRDIVKSPSGEIISDLVYGKEIFLSAIPEYSDKPYYVINNNIPYFPPVINTEISGFEFYSPLDSLGRCGVAFGILGPQTLPTEERGNIGMVRPTGWHTVRYDDIIEGKYLYNRCHLIGYQLSGENANENNLITGTRYFNISGMLPFENMTEDYIKETGNHALYRVTPIFVDDELVCRGVIMEARSIEDHGKGLSFNVFVYNVQPGIKIDYATGESQTDR